MSSFRGSGIPPVAPSGDHPQAPSERYGGSALPTSSKGASNFQRGLSTRASRLRATYRGGQVQSSPMQRQRAPQNPASSLTAASMPGMHISGYFSGVSTAPTSRRSDIQVSQAPGGNVDDDDAGSTVDVPEDEAVMAIEMNDKGPLGCAYYQSKERSLRLFNDLGIAELDVIAALLCHIQPTTVLLPFKTQDAIINFLEKEAGSGLTSFILRTLASSDFNKQAALDHLATLPLCQSLPQRAFVQATRATRDSAARQDEPDRGTSVDNMRLGSFINLESHSSIGCAGAVLNHILRRQDAAQAGDAASVSHPVETLEMFSLSDFMLLNADTLESLQILRSELHPNNQAWGSKQFATGEKESLSIYGLFHSLAGTSQGRARLRQLFLRPLVDIEEIGRRQAAIAVLLSPENAETMQHIKKHMKQLPDVRQALSQLQKGVDAAAGQARVERGPWWALTRFTLHALYLKDSVSRLRGFDHASILAGTVANVPVAILKKVGEAIGRTIDFEESKVGSRLTVKWGLNDALDALKRDLNGLEDLLNRVCTDICQSVPKWAIKYVSGCIFWPQMGFLTVVTLNTTTNEPAYDGQGLQDDRWQQVLVIDGKAYYKNRRMKELDDYMGDVHGKILDAQIDIIHELSISVLRHEAELGKCSDAFGELDAIVALALGAEKYRWVAPQMTDNNIIQIREGRHPLQELVAPSFIPNDCYLSGGAGKVDGDASDISEERTFNDTADSRIMVLTGPNHSGKSVYIKQVGLIVYLAHVGSYVPAEEAIIGLTDQILTRMSTRESVAHDESAFAIDLRQAAFCMKSSTSRSLVLVDEFGKGTRADDGAGLMTALLDHFQALSSHMPRVLVATHFHEIFEGGHLGEDRNIALYHMDVRLDLETDQEENVLTYLFKLTLGRSTSSFGSRCAAMNGVDAAVIDRAEAISLILARNGDLGAACAKLDHEDEVRLEEAEKAARRFLQVEPASLCVEAGGNESILTKVNAILSGTQ